jgi:hypothetical protein
MSAEENLEHWTATKQVQGATVYNTALEKLGSIDDLLISDTTSRLTHAVVKFGGHFYMGSHYSLLPWGSFSYSEELRGYIVDIDRDMLALRSCLVPAFGGVG